MDVGKTPETAAGLFFLWELKALLYVGFITVSVSQYRTGWNRFTLY